MRSALPLAALFLAAGLSSAQWPEIVRLHPVVSGFRNPVDIAFPPDDSGRMLVVEQAGRIRLVQNGRLRDESFLDINGRVRSGGEQGLLGLAFPPDFTSKQYFYVNYTDVQGDTVVSRFRVTADGNRAVPESEAVILRLDQPYANHNGGGLAFGPDGYLYVGTGDGGSGGDPDNHAQRTNTLLGKMLRIDTESGTAPYSVPQSNPFTNRTGARPEIWATGLRNPWRYSFDRETGDLWIADVGQGRAEEVSFQPASSTGGENYGWRIMEGLQCFPPGTACNRDALTLPVLEYGRDLGFSVTGGHVYRGSRYPELDGVYLYGDFGSGRLWGVRRSGASWENRELLDTSLSISTFGEDPQGEIYVADHGAGTIYLLVAGAPAVSENGVVNAASFGPGLVAGSLATIFGRGLTSLPGIVAASAFPVASELEGTSVRIGDVEAPVLGLAYVSGQEQINIQIPFELAGSTSASLVVTANGQASEAVQVPIASVQPEIFAVTRTGDVVTIWATGLGAVTNPPATAVAAPADPLAMTVADTAVTIGGAEAQVQYSGLAPGWAGLYQANALVPRGATGDLILSAGGVPSLPWREPIP